MKMINLKNYLKENFLFYKGEMYDVSKGEIFNPPFFINFIIENPENNNDVKTAWNLTLVNGLLIIPKSYTKILKNKKFTTTKINNKDYAVYKKIDSDIFIRYDQYRVFDFYIIGVEKGGTTSLLSNLSKHPDIYMAKPKSHLVVNNYFNYQLTKLNRNRKWLKSQFNYKKIVGAKIQILFIYLILINIYLILIHM